MQIYVAQRQAYCPRGQAGYQRRQSAIPAWSQDDVFSRGKVDQADHINKLVGTIAIGTILITQRKHIAKFVRKFGKKFDDVIKGFEFKKKQASEPIKLLGAPETKASKKAGREIFEEVSAEVDGKKINAKLENADAPKDNLNDTLNDKFQKSYEHVMSSIKSFVDFVNS